MMRNRTNTTTNSNSNNNSSSDFRNRASTMSSAGNRRQSSAAMIRQYLLERDGIDVVGNQSTPTSQLPRRQTTASRISNNEAQAQGTAVGRRRQSTASMIKQQAERTGAIRSTSIVGREALKTQITQQPPSPIKQGLEENGSLTDPILRRESSTPLRDVADPNVSDIPGGVALSLGPLMLRSPLPSDWEELIDHETQHRFFANIINKKTSWTDPRDSIVNVGIVKGNTGLGIGLSSAKKVTDSRGSSIISGIFVSSLVPGAAAALDGRLKEGDEILELNGHSLIGVDRDTVIMYLKQAPMGSTVELVVSQESFVTSKQTVL